MAPGRGVTWGTNAQSIQVEEGDSIRAGQLIGWAGNTWTAKRKLNDDGSPESATVNTHLHFSLAVEHPTETDTFIRVDPYGVHTTAGDCYSFLKDTEFHGFFAPFSSTFHGLPFEVLDRYFHYYTSMGRGLRTIHLHLEHEKGTREEKCPRELAPDQTPWILPERLGFISRRCPQSAADR